MKKQNRSARLSLPIKIAVAAILLILVIVPIIRMFSTMKSEDWQAVVSAPLFQSALINSVVLSLIATLISLVMAYFLAFAMVRTDIPLKKLWGVLLTLPMLIPSLSHGMGLITLFGQNGILTRLLNTPDIYGPVGIVMGSVMYAFPVAYIMLSDVLKYEDLSVYEAADILGISKTRQFLRISLPYLKKPLIAALFSTFSLIVTDYGVPVLVGAKTYTISSLMYTEAAARGNFGRGTVYAIFLLLPAILAFITDIFNKDKGTSSFVKRDMQKKTALPLKIAALTLCVAVSLFALLPILSFAIWAFAESYPRDLMPTFDHVMNTLKHNGLTFLINSLIIALLTAVVGTVLSYITAYLTARMKSSVSRLIHLLVLTFMAIPGMVLGLSYAMTFSGTFLYGTVMILIMVNVAHFMSSPYLMMYNSFGKMNENLEAVGQTLGIGRIRMLKDVLIPQSISTIAEMFSYLFVNAMMTISAVSFLANSTTKPISLMINQYKDYNQFEGAAVVSLMILAGNLLLKGLIGLIRHCLQKKRKDVTV